MSVYVDQIMRHGGSTSFRWVDSCHMFADTLDELHEMAVSIGLKRQWFQVSRSGFKHYDLTVGKRKQAVAKGAIFIRGHKALARKFKQLRETQCQK